MKKVLLIVSFLLCFGLYVNAQQASIHLKNGWSSIDCFITGYDEDSVIYTKEGEEGSFSTLKKDIDEIEFNHGFMTFTEEGEMKFRSAGFAPQSWWETSTVDYGKFTLHGRPYKGPVLYNTHTKVYYAGTNWVDAQGILVPVK